ncbi:IS1096 element passenger TnpR family protein [Azospirillum halopraeferens]|uniref:IS1096 element passenger TnpR family protein n=1 Tax=Azospirillum halopraeferens TaxID=34010 RepID=UPI0009FC09E8
MEGPSTTSPQCPPEDIGGPWGYEPHFKAIADPGHERHAEMIECAHPASIRPPWA